MNVIYTNKQVQFDFHTFHLFVMYSFLIFCLFFKNSISIHSKSWIPKYENENAFNEPYDYVEETHLPNLANFGNGYDWIGVAGTSLIDRNKSYVAFTGTRKNNNASFNSVYTQQSGIIVLCSSNMDSTSGMGFKLSCKTLEENHLNSTDSKYFGAVVRSTKSKNDTIAFIYCDPLWVDTKSTKNQPSGKCKLTLLQDFENMKHQEFIICESFKKCLGGFSVDLISIDQDLNIMFGLPFENATILLNRAESYKIDQGILTKGDFFNFGYAVSFSGDGVQYISSPVSDEYSPFVKMVNGEKFYPTDIKSQRYGGFGTSIDTLRVSNFLYGVVIGAPHQSKQNLPNVGAVFLACKGHLTHMVSGENAYDFFGYSVARLGDINSDGSEEFVVSAPSLNFDKPGKIYIYGTTKDCQISKSPMQIYQSKINGFGISISRGFDINFNSMPDFFVTALDYQTPLLFKMPNQGKITCSWIEQNEGTIFVKDDTFDIKIIFNSHNINNYNDYIYQVAIDFLNKDEPRFKLIESKLLDNTYLIKLQALLDVQDMDLKANPLQVAVRGIRSCKISDQTKCYSTKVAHIRWLDCEKIIKLSQFMCNSKVCLSDLNMTIKGDAKGSIIYYGEQKDYQRTIEIILSNNGPDSTPRIYMSIDSRPDLLITNVRCIRNCKKELTATGQNAKIVVKELMQKRENVDDDFKIVVDVLYNKLENVSATTSINFNIWGVNDDNYVVNNNYNMSYSILFKSNLTFSSMKTKETIIDSRIKPPYLETDMRIALQELGTELQYSYVIENKGPELKNVEFKFYFPFKTETNKYILYIMDKIRLSSDETWQSSLPHISNKSGVVQTCMIPNEMQNPLHLIGIETYKHPKSGVLNRLKRALSDENMHMENSTVISLQSQDEKPINFISPRRTTVVRCNEISKGLGLPFCGEIICKLKVVPMNSEFKFNFRSWLFTQTFFDARIADLSIITSLQSNLGDLPKGITILDNSRLVGPLATSQKVLFDKMKIAEDKPLPIWPIIVAIIIGIFLLVIIIVIAYYCGFFKRKRLRKERQKIRERAHKNEETDHTPLKATY